MSSFSNQNKVLLRVFLDSDDTEWKAEYAKHVKNHNERIENNPYPDSGFDLLVPKDCVILDESINSVFLDLQVKTEMVVQHLNGNEEPAAYFLFARSSFSKTPLMLSNHTGIIDAGYRGNLKVALRNLGKKAYAIEKYTRLVQICHPTLQKITVVIVEKESDLSSTVRGDGGFGSTGK
jgi:dUTP pyrophosphatase